MATTIDATHEAVSHSQYLTFYMGEEECGIGILKVKEIIEYQSVTTVPGTPPWIRGVINVRGTVVPIVDMALKFGLAACAVTKRTCIVIVEVDLEGQPTPMGVMADSVNQVIELQPEDIEEAPSFGTQVRVDYLLGMGKVGDGFVLMLDIDRVLSAGELLTVSGLSDAAANAGAAVEESATEAEVDDE